MDQLSDLTQAAFSSAALPLAAVERFGLPASVVAHRWSSWCLLGPGEALRRWQGPRPLGAVLDFAALRHWLVEQACGWGARLELGLRALRCEPDGAGGLRTLVRDREVVDFGLSMSADVTARVDMALYGSHLELMTPSGNVEIPLRIAGRHNVANACAAAACAGAAGVPLE
mgnify:CR=1 FL=1